MQRAMPGLIWMSLTDVSLCFDLAHGTSSLSWACRKNSRLHSATVSPSSISNLWSQDLEMKQWLRIFADYQRRRADYFQLHSRPIYRVNHLLVLLESWAWYCFVRFDKAAERSILSACLYQLNCLSRDVSHCPLRHLPQCYLLAPTLSYC